MSTPEEGDGAGWVPYIGELVKIKPTGQLGKLLAREWGKVQVRAVKGGIEWDIEPGDLVKPTDEERVSVGVRHANAASRVPR
ncbi:hypothetical protein ACTVZO_22080 [Streptomyces sp. IBSNAI002]|uniref:hypothetical protein n=1 Tax=Streptomyces sp. IBSNAI002 TaxID=3457500 RepID=UPI003FD3082A